MKEKIYRLNPDSITKEDRQALADWITSEPAPQLTMGPLVKEYEEKFSNWIRRKYSLSCNSGSSANLLMAYALLQSGRLDNKKVIVPSAGWATSVSPFIQLGFEPIMCEADPQNWGLDPVHLEELLVEHQPSTVMLVHVLGVPAHMEEILYLKEKYNFYLLEDTCAALGSSYQDTQVGRFGIMSSISTYYGHQFSTIEGGIISTDDSELYALLLMLRSHGWLTQLDRTRKMLLLDEYGMPDIGTNFVFCEPGFNFRLTELQAFFGLRQIDRLDWLVRKRIKNHELYKKILSKYFQVQTYDQTTKVCSIHFCALAKSWEKRNKIVNDLEKEGISTRPFTSGNQGAHPYWFRKFGTFTGLMANRLYECGFFLPNHPYLEEEDIKFICQTVLKGV